MLDLANFAQMLQFQPEDGMITFRGNRMLLFNADALCQLREELIRTLGMEIARGVLTRFGYRHGFNDVNSVRAMFDIRTDAEWMMAGPLMHTIEGLVHVTNKELQFDRVAGTFHMQGIWRNSYEAEQHLKLYGPGAEAVCWTLTGYASGFASGFMGREAVAIETMCRAKGDPDCCYEIRNIEAWGEEARRYINDLKPNAVVKSMEKMLDEERRRVVQWRALSQASVEITSHLDAESLLRRFVNYARTLMFAEHSLVAVFNEQAPGLQLYRNSGGQEWQEATGEVKGALTSLMGTGLPLNITCVEDEQDLPDDVRNLLGVPLLAHGRIIGAMVVANKQGAAAFSHDDQELLLILAGQVAIAIENVRLYKRTDDKLQQKVIQLNNLNIVLSTQNAAVKKSAAIHNQLTNLVLEGKGIDAITTTLAQIVSNPIAVEDASFKLISRAGTYLSEGTELQCLSARNILDNPELEAQRVILREERRIVKVPLSRSEGRGRHQYLVPIVAGRDILGYASCLEGHKKLEDLDRTALEHAGTVYALELLKLKAAFETELRLKEDFLGELLSGNYHSEEQLLQQAAKLGLNLNTTYLVVLLDLAPKESAVDNVELRQRLLGQVNQGVRAHSAHSIVVNKNKQILILLALPKNSNYLDIFNKLGQHLKDGVLHSAPGYIWRLAAGTTCHRIPDFRRSYEEASSTLEVMCNINRQNTFMAYDQLGVFGMLEINKKRFAEFTSKVIGPLLDYDAKHHSQLVETLRLYYRNNGNVQQAARRGYLNPSTLKYRLKRIQEIAGIDLDDPDTALQVQLALKLVT